MEFGLKGKHRTDARELRTRTAIFLKQLSLVKQYFWDTQGGGGANGPSASARLYDEMEAEKRVRKRRMRLLLAVEDAFAHAGRMAKDASAGINRNSVGSAAGMSPFHNGTCDPLLT